MSGSEEPLYLNRHRSQYQAGASLVTRRSGCTWTTAANGADASTGGRVDLSPDAVHALVPRSQEADPSTPGWQLADTDRAMSKLGLPFVLRAGWANLVHAVVVDGCYVTVPGDSDAFGDHTCSGAFDGDHNIGIHPAVTVAGQATIDDPICRTRRAESWDTLRRYATRYSATVPFGVWLSPVPPVEAVPMSDTINAPGVTSARQGTIAKGRPWYHDSELTDGGGTFSANATVPYIGAAKGGGRAVLINTGVPYDDGVIRPTIAYVRPADLTISDVPPEPPPDCSDCLADLAKAHQAMNAAITTLQEGMKP